MPSNVAIVIAGAGHFGREVRGWVNMSGHAVQRFIDDDESGCENIRDYTPIKENEQILVAISDPKGREKVVNELVHRAAIFHGLRLETAPVGVVIGGGSIFCPHSLVSCGAEIGNFTICNVFSSIGHDVKMGHFCTLSSHVDICGNVRVGDRVFFGSGARVMPGVTIGDDAVIGAGAVVMADVPAGATMYAQPARRM